MPSRARDWLAQGKRDLGHASHALEDGDFEWACFAAQQACEKAVKFVYQNRGEEAWGHSVADLLEGLRTHLAVAEALLDMAKELDKHYIPTRHPNAHSQGAPFMYYTQGEAQRAISYAEKIIGFCENLFPG